MKSKNTYLFFFLSLASLIGLQVGCSKQHDHDSAGGHSHDSEAAHGHDHGTQAHAVQQKAGGPNGGRIVDSAESRFEFLLRSDRRVQLTFLDASGNTLAPSAQEISLTGGDRSSPTRLSFVQEGDVLLSSETLPAATNLPIVLQIKANPTAQVVIEKFMLNMSTCPSCDNREYACVCNHDVGHGHPHDEHSDHKH